MDRNINFLFRKTNNDTRQLNIELLNTNNSLKESKNDAKKLLENAKQKVYCEVCDANINKSSYLRHLKSSKHKLKEQIAILANPSSDDDNSD